jgi:hypothetical protein
MKRQRFRRQVCRNRDQSNNSVPILEILQVPDNEDIEIIVMPFLRVYGSPRFDTFGECVDFIRQIFEVGTSVLLSSLVILT